MSGPRHDLIVTDGPGEVISVTNDTALYMDVLYASVTAPTVTKIEVYLGERLHEVVFAGNGGSHSWWLNAGGKLLDHNGLDPGQTMRIVSDGPCALRLDWI